MGVEEVKTTNITCDNPNCPGHPELDPADRTGWLFVSHEVYGEPTEQHVFGSASCLSVASGDEATAEEFGFTKKTELPESQPTP